MNDSMIARSERLHDFESHEDFNYFRLDGGGLVPHMFVRVQEDWYEEVVYSYGYSPDGVGVYWHEALEDLEQYVRRGYVL